MGILKYILFISFLYIIELRLKVHGHTEDFQRIISLENMYCTCNLWIFSPDIAHFAMTQNLVVNYYCTSTVILRSGDSRLFSFACTHVLNAGYPLRDFWPQKELKSDLPFMEISSHIVREFHCINKTRRYNCINISN